MMGYSNGSSNLSPRRQPFIFVTGALVAGILLDRMLALPIWLTTLLLLSSIGVAISLYRKNGGVGVSVVLLAGFIIAGAALSAAAKGSARPDRLRQLVESGAISPADPVRLSGILERPPEPIPEGVLLDLRAQEVQVARRVLSASGSARLMLPLRDETALNEFSELQLDYACQVRILLRLEPARAYGNPGSPNFDDFLERRGYDLKGAIKSPLLIQVVARPQGNAILRAIFNARLWLMGRLDRHFPAQVAGTLKAMLAGNRSFVDPETAARLRQGAAFHVLVIAGLHIGIIAWLLLGRSSATRRNSVRALAALAVLWAYAIAVGMEPPVVRATTMITVGIIGPLIFRQSVSLNTLALAGSIMLVVNPAAAFDAGFQLSFAAVAGIVGLAVPLSHRLRDVGGWRPSASTPHPPGRNAIRMLSEVLFWDQRSFERDIHRSDISYGVDKARSAVFAGRWLVQRLIRYAALLMITSLAIQLATLPLMIFYFNRVAPVGIIINIVAGLMAAIIMTGSFLTICTAPASAWLSETLAHIVVAAHQFLVNAVVPFLSIPGASFRCPHYEGSGRLFYWLYYIPLALLVVLLDRWRPVDVFLPIKWLDARSADGAARGLRSSSEGSRTESTSKAAVHWFRIRERTGRVRRFQTIRLPGMQALACLAILAALIVTINRPFSAIGNGKLVAYFLDVGQGDSALVVFPRGSTMLVDAGGEIHIRDSRTARSGENNVEPEGGEEAAEPDLEDNAPGIGELVVSRFLWSLGLRKLDYSLATHAHEDHIGGFNDVLRNFTVRELIVGHSPRSSPEFRRLTRMARARQTHVATMIRGDRFTVDGVQVEALWPRAGDEDSPSGNNDSVVLLLRYRSVAFILAGDIEQPAEAYLCSQDDDLRADLLKVPHHGSRTSSTDEFIDKVNPRYAIVSVGSRSRFGHPHADVIRKYLDRGVQLLQTGRDGMVTAETDGNELHVRTFRQTSTGASHQQLAP